MGRIHEVKIFSDWRSTQTVRTGGKGGFMFGLSNEVMIIAGSMVLAILMIMIVIAKMYRKVGPNEALIRYGMGGTEVYCGKGALIFPMVQTCRDLSLELMSFDVAPQQDLYTNQGVAVTVEAVAQIKVKSDDISIRTGAEQFLTKTPPQREGLIRLVMEGHLRGIIGQLTVEQIVKEPEMVGDRMRSTCADDMSKMGLEVISFTNKEVRDKSEYITNMGRPDVARIRRDAEVATAEAERDIAIKRAEAQRAAAVAKAQADQERVAAETASLAKQAEAQRDLDIKKAAFLEATKKAQAQADKAYEIETNVQQQHVIAEAVKVQQVEREAQVKVQEAEIARRERELIATVLKQAEIARQRRTPAAHERSGGPRGVYPRARRSRSRNHLQERRSGSQSYEHQGRSFPGIQPGRRGRQTHHRLAGSRARAQRAAQQSRQSHHRFHGR